MEVADECADAGEVVGVEGDRAFLSCRKGGVVVLGAQRESTELETGGFVLSFEEDSAVFRENCDRRFSKKNAAVMIAQGANADEIMVEVRHDVPGGGGEVGEEDVARDRGTVG